MANRDLHLTRNTVIWPTSMLVKQPISERIFVLQVRRINRWGMQLQWTDGPGAERGITITSAATTWIETMMVNHKINLIGYSPQWKKRRETR